MTDQLPAGLEYVRTTDTFDHEHHPAGPRRAHRVADDVWARLLVHTGTLAFVFEDEPDHVLRITGGQSLVIPPGRLHHVDFDAPATFALEFYRRRDDATPVPGTESGGLSAT